MCGRFSHAPKWGTWPATQACALTGSQIGDPLVPSEALSPLSHTSQGCFVILSESPGCIPNNF